MKRFLSITVMIFAATPAFADILSFTNPSILSTANCAGVTGTQTATLSLPNQAPITMAVKGREIRQQKVLFSIKDGYCATVLASDGAGFDKALAAKDPTGAAIRNAVSGQNGTGGMLFAIRMDIMLQVGAPALLVKQSYSDALEQNTAQSAADLKSEPSTGPLNSFLNLSFQQDGASQNQNFVVTVDGRPGETFGQVYYQNASGKLTASATGTTPAFIQDMIAIWIGDTTLASMNALHKAFEQKLLGL